VLGSSVLRSIVALLCNVAVGAAEVRAAANTGFYHAALEMPFLLLPFRPGSDALGSKNFIRQYFKARYDGHSDVSEMAHHELRLMEPIVSFCLSRQPSYQDLTVLSPGALQYHEMVLEQITWRRSHLGYVRTLSHRRNW
jgi:hypothetical protein